MLLEVKDIIKHSEKRLNKLKILNNFFNHTEVIAIAARTKAIHHVFATNDTLDINKLELFHLQYTDSLLDLIAKLKKKNEQQYLLLMNEIQINDEVIKSIGVSTDSDFFKEKVKEHNTKFQKFIALLYNELAFEKKQLQKKEIEEINQLSKDWGIGYYRKIALNDFVALMALSCNLNYDIDEFRIEKKLLGKLNIQKFRFKFLCGLQFNNQFIELYEFIDSNDYFVFLKEKKEFLFIDIKQFRNIDFSKNNSGKSDRLLELKNKNIDLTNKAEQIIKFIPMEVEEILNNYNQKISSFELLDDLQNIDEQANILKTMLNINIK